MSSATAIGRLVVEALLDAGMQHAVIAPGSRSAPVALALAQAEQAGLVQLHVRIDERDAGFLALGLSKASGLPVPVVVTSGSAVANLFPAIVEAYQSSIPVVAVTADRPAKYRGTNAAQTILQENIFGTYTTHAFDVAAELIATDNQLRNLHAQLADVFANSQGPAHLNLQFEMPLLPSVADLDWKPSRNISHTQSRANQVTAPSSLPDKAAAQMRVDWQHDVPTQSSAAKPEQLVLPAHGLMIVGDIADVTTAHSAAQLAQVLGWPIIWEPTGQVHNAQTALAHGPLLLASNALPIPDAVMTVGTVGLSRAVVQTLAQTPQHIAVAPNSESPVLPNGTLTAAQLFDVLPEATSTVDANWLAIWQQADAAVRGVVQHELAGETLTGPRAAVSVWNQLSNTDQLFIAASWPVRHIEAYAPCRPGLRTFGNRGTNGIDGLISTAWGIAQGSGQHTCVLIGDVAFLHDIGGLNVPEETPLPNLSIVVLDNDGGGIFSQLEQGRDEYEQYFERIFGTPHGKDLWVIAEAFGIPARRVTTQHELSQALHQWQLLGGVQVIVCTTGSRRDEAAQIARIAKAAHDVLEQSV